MGFLLEAYEEAVMLGHAGNDGSCADWDTSCAKVAMRDAVKGARGLALMEWHVRLQKGL